MMTFFRFLNVDFFQGQKVNLKVIFFKIVITAPFALNTLKLILNYFKIEFFQGQKVNFWKFQVHQSENGE